MKRKTMLLALAFCVVIFILCTIYWYEAYTERWLSNTVWRARLWIPYLSMPVGLGFSVAQRLHSMGLSGIPIIFITASKLKGLRETAESLGAVAFFEKPYDADQLLAAVARGLHSNPVAPAKDSLATVCG